MWSERGAWAAPAIALAAYGLPEGSPEAWACKTGLLGAALVLTAGWRVASSGFDDIPGRAWPWLTLAGWFALTAVWSGDPARSIFQASAVGALACLVATGLPGSVRWMTWTVLAVAGYETAAGLLSAGTAAGIRARVSGTFVNADHYAALLGMAIAILFTRVMTASRRSLAWSVAALVVVAAAAGSSASRATVLAAAVMAVAAWRLAPHGGSGKGWWIASGSAAAGLAAAPALAIRLADQAVGREAAAWSRLELWSASIQALREAPLGGAGLGGFGGAFMAIRPARLAMMSSEYAHSEVLQVAVESGIIGLGLLLWGVVVTLAAMRRWRGGDAATVGLALAALSVAVVALVDFPLHAPAIALPAVIAAVIAGRPSPAVSRPQPRWAVGAIWAVAGGAALWFLSAGAADWCYASGVRLELGGDVEGARSRFHDALGAEPENAGALQGLAELTPDDANAPVEAARAARLRPGWPDAQRTLLDQAVQRHDAPAADAAMARLEVLDPNGLETRLARIRWMLSGSRFVDAGTELAAVEAVWPSELDVWYAAADLAERLGRKAEARRLLRHIVRIYPSAEFARNWLGRLGKP